MQFVQADATQLPFADGSFDLVFGSPPYADARTYGIGAQRDAAAWVEFMLRVTKEACRVSKGLVLWVAAGVTRKWNYWPCCEGLMWEWFKRGNQQWRPAFWHRVGIPGSGGKQWLRADIEYVLAFTSCKAAIPWADNTANGHPPKWAPGGEMSYRTADGERVNYTPRTMGDLMAHKSGNRRAVDGTRQSMGTRDFRNGVKQITRRISQGHGPDGDTRQDDVYAPPVLANPGVLIRLPLTLAELTSILKLYEQTSTTADSVLRELRQAYSSGRLREWFYGVCLQVRAAKVLQHSLCNSAVYQRATEAEVPVLRSSNPETEGRVDQRIPGQEVLQSQVPRSAGSKARRTKARGPSTSGEKDSQADDATDCLRGLRPSIGLLQQALPEIQEVWESVNEMLWPGQTEDSPNLITGIKVGGGLMGHSLSHVNEAPFPVRLAQWFIRSWCPPGGRVLDPFSGSGTTVAAAASLGRVGYGCDLRLNQCQLGRRRCAEVQTDLFV